MPPDEVDTSADVSGAYIDGMRVIPPPKAADAAGSAGTGGTPRFSAPPSPGGSRAARQPSLLARSVASLRRRVTPTKTGDARPLMTAADAYAPLPEGQYDDHCYHVDDDMSELAPRSGTRAAGTTRSATSGPLLRPSWDYADALDALAASSHSHPSAPSTTAGPDHPRIRFADPAAMPAWPLAMASTPSGLLDEPGSVSRDDSRNQLLPPYLHPTSPPSWTALGLGRRRSAKNRVLTPSSPAKGRAGCILATLVALLVVLGIALGVGLGVGLHRRSSATHEPTRLPNPPANATFLRWTPCPDQTMATVPLMHSDLWADPTAATPSTATVGVVIQHGIGRNFNGAFAGLSPNLNLSSTVLIAPNFYLPQDVPKRSRKTNTYSNWYNASDTLAWNNFTEWVGGGDPVAPTAANASSDAMVGTGKQCSTYDVYDGLVALLTNTTLYPSMQHIIIAGHSGGAALVSRYALLAEDPPAAAAGRPNVTMRYVHANSPSFPYFTTMRPNATANCGDQDGWMYGMVEPNRYASKQLSQPVKTLFRRYVERDVVQLQGNMDTRAWFPIGDYTCEVEAQGGNDRRDRNYAWWVYKNLLAGWPTNVTALPFYANLAELIPTSAAFENTTLPAAFSFGSGSSSNGTSASTSSVSSPALGGYLVTAATRHDDRAANVRPFRHRFCVVDGVGHVAPLMWNSTCGHAAFDPLQGTPASMDLASTSDWPEFQPQKLHKSTNTTTKGF